MSSFAQVIAEHLPFDKFELLQKFVKVNQPVILQTTSYHESLIFGKSFYVRLESYEQIFINKIPEGIALDNSSPVATEKGMYVNGMKEGVWFKFDKNNDKSGLLSIGTYHRNQQHGYWEYFKNGQVVEQRFYKMGFFVEIPT